MTNDSLNNREYILGFGVYTQNFGADHYIAVVKEFLTKENLYQDGKVSPQFAAFATIDQMRNCPKINAMLKAFDRPCHCFTAEQLNVYKDQVLNPSDFVFDNLGTPSVSEAASLAAFDGKGKLYVAKTASAPFTFALSYKEINS